MSAYRVTFIADYYVLKTTVEVESDTEVNDAVIINKADELVRRETGFSPFAQSWDFDIEEVETGL